MTTLLNPLINEKSMLVMKDNSFTFEVSKDATKNKIERIIAKKFNVDVLSVRIINLPRKKKTQRTRRGFYHTSATKKAIIQLKKGQKIALFEAVSKTEEVEVRTGEEVPTAKIKEKKSLLSGTKVKIENELPRSKSSILRTQTEGLTRYPQKAASSFQNKEEDQKEADTKRPTKVSQKEKKKG